MPALKAASADPATADAVRQSVLLAGTCLAVGWPAGVLAAIGIWQAGPWLRRLVIGLALLVLLLPPSLSAGEFGWLDATFVRPWAIGAVLSQAPPVAGLVLLIVTSKLNQLDPLVLRSAAANGALPWQAWRLAVLPSVATTLAFAASAAFALGVSQAGPSLPGLDHPTLATLLRQASRQDDMAAAPLALLLAGLALAPLPLLGLLVLLRRRGI